MLDDFFIRALLAGVGVALVTGPLGCFVVWRRLAYFGETLSHSALLGVVLAFLLQINVTLAVFGVCAAVALSVLALQRNASLSSDSLLGMLAHSSLALGLVALAFMSSVRVDLMGFLFGDILAVSRLDLTVIYIGGGIVIAVLFFVWRALFAATVNYDLAEAEGLRPDRANVVFMLLMAVVIAISMKIVGVLLITALLIIPAATARQLARGPEQMAVFAAILGTIAVIAGLFGSLEWDTPSGPSIVVAAATLFVLVLLPVAVIARRRAPAEGRPGA
tara:strand:- start:237323 stop:238150 length:828 start_codon:yes stop_codon:yes gene_type:complete